MLIELYLKKMFLRLMVGFVVLSHIEYGFEQDCTPPTRRGAQFQAVSTHYDLDHH